MKKLILTGLVAALAMGSLSLPAQAAGYSEFGQYGRPGVLIFEDTEEQIAEEIRLGEMEVLAQLVEAEAGSGVRAGMPSEWWLSVPLLH